LTGNPVLEAPPISAELTEYDRQHFATYCMLLDADAAGAPWPEAVEYIFELDEPYDSPLAKTIHDTHLARALWFTHTEYRLLLRGS
jgi:hypothetical protein